MRRRIRAAAVPVHRHSLPQIAVDGALVALAYYLAFRLRFDNGPREPYALLRDRTVGWVVVGSLVVLVAGRVYQRRWRYSSQRDYVALTRGIVTFTLLTVLAVAVVRPVVTQHEDHKLVAIGLPNGVSVLFLLLCLAFLLGVRVLARTLHERRPLGVFSTGGKGRRNVLIVGAGDGGRLVLREIVRNRELGLVPVGFLDDDPKKHGLRIDGVRVRGDTQGQLPRILDEAEPDEVIIAIPSAPGTTRARVVSECRKRGVPVRTLPTVFELLQDRGPGTIAHQVREVRVEDVLGRDPVHLELRTAGAYLTGEVVLVTGAGGSIGSELCRQIAQVHPRKIVLLDHAEDNLFSITRELEEERHVPPAVLCPVLADCKAQDRMAEVFSEHRPDVVFHAAAYKHVGLMEGNPVEAVRNNAFATRLIAMLAGEHAAGRFVLVSTDKAVSPQTVMGASKALAELSLEAASVSHPQTRYAAVRFGNVLGSSGSVVPIFRRQIERGGPVTVTDERMTRYFMTIPEAVQLIIRAGAIGGDGAIGGAGAVGGAGAIGAGPGAELFVLDMGDPVRIVDLANAMIELSGLTPGKDIAVEVVGARPGEKLSEELYADHERAMATEAEKILRVQRRPASLSAIQAAFDEVEALLAEGDPCALAGRIAELAVAPWVAEPASSRAKAGGPDGHAPRGAEGHAPGGPEGQAPEGPEGQAPAEAEPATVRLRPS